MAGKPTPQKIVLGYNYQLTRYIGRMSKKSGIQNSPGPPGPWQQPFRSKTFTCSPLSTPPSQGLCPPKRRTCPTCPRPHGPGCDWRSSRSIGHRASGLSRPHRNGRRSGPRIRTRARDRFQRTKAKAKRCGETGEW